MSLQRGPLLPAKGRWLWALGVAMLLGLFAGGCVPWGRGAYQVEIFSEMHYSQSYRFQEPPRLYPAVGAVPFVPVGPGTLVVEQAVPPARTLETDLLGGELYRVNCSVCHGVGGKGDGPMRDFLLRWGGIPPFDITSAATSQSTDEETFNFIAEGGRIGFAVAQSGVASPSPMPIFKKLLREQEIWALVHYVRALQGR